MFRTTGCALSKVEMAAHQPERRHRTNLHPARSLISPSVGLDPARRECVASFRQVRRPTRRERSYTPGWDCACTLVIDDNDAFRGDCAFRHLESRRDRAIGKQAFSTAQRYRKYLQPERIDQIMLEERLNEICASINVQIWPFLLLNFGDFFRNMSV